MKRIKSETIKQTVPADTPSPPCRAAIALDVNFGAALFVFDAQWYVVGMSDTLDANALVPESAEQGSHVQAEQTTVTRLRAAEKPFITRQARLAPSTGSTARSSSTTSRRSSGASSST